MRRYTIKAHLQATKLQSCSLPTSTRTAGKKEKHTAPHLRPRLSSPQDCVLPYGRVGIAVGVANVLIKSLVTKGYVRASRVTWKGWAYILTPAGVARKVQLTANYVDRFLDHYRTVR